MGFNYGLEKKNFDRQWAIMRKQYEDAGMSIWYSDNDTSVIRGPVTKQTGWLKCQ